jgi:hypothetical protein
MSNTPEAYSGSAAFQLVVSRGWKWKETGTNQIELEECPFCKKTGYGHLYMSVHGSQSDTPQRDGLYNCHKCGKSGNLITLKQHLGLIIPGVESRKDYFSKDREIEPLPDIDACHEALLQDEAALDYLVNGRGFSYDIIQKQKIGLTKRRFRKAGEVRAIVYPYLVNGNPVFAHFRTLPTMPVSENKVPKDFASPKGWDAPLYNGEIIRPGINEVIFVEGEANTIAAMDKGVDNVVGFPGAHSKKAEWLEALDSLAPDKIYILYDNDKVGQKAGQQLAMRIGIHKCLKLTLPDFDVTVDGETRKGKDLNEWFHVGGGTPEKLEALKADAVLFDVEGVTNSTDAIQEFYDYLKGKKNADAKYKTPWASLNKYIGFDDGDVIDILAPEKIGKTTFAMNLLEFMCENYEDDGVIICLEMTRAKLARKYICHKTQIMDTIAKTPEESQALFDSFMTAIPPLQTQLANREGTLYFCYPTYKTMDDLYKLIIEIIRRYGVKWVAFDNVQRACDSTLGSRGRTEHLSTISKTLSQIAKDYAIQMVRILQPHRVREGEMCNSNNVDGASQIAKDCDAMIVLDRVASQQLDKDKFETMKVVESETTFGSEMFVNVGLSRYSSGGGVTLHYEGAMSTICEISEADKLKLMAESAAAQVMQSPEAEAAKMKEALKEATEGDYDGTI